MNEKIKELAEQATVVRKTFHGIEHITFDKEKFAELIVQECANLVREKYDHEHAESIAWGLEIEFGLHGDYAE